MSGSSSAAPGTPASLVAREDAELDDVEGGEAELCVKCGIAVAAGERGSFGKRSRQIVHTVCITKYKAVQRKRTTDPTFKAWFDQKTDEEKQVYYRARLDAHKPQLKQKLQDLEASAAEVTETGTEQRALGIWVDYTMFKETEEMKGLHDEAAIKSRWHQRLLEVGAKTMKYQGRVLLYKFQGLETATVERNYQQSKLGTKQKLHNRDDLDSARALAQDAQERSAKKAKLITDELMPDAECAMDLLDNVITGWTDAGKQFGRLGSSSATADDMEVIVDIEEQIAEAEAALDEEDRLEIAVFQAKNKELLDRLEHDALNKNVEKMRLQVGARYSVAAGAIDAAVSEQRDSSAKVCARATKVFGGDGWKDYPTVKSLVDKVKEASEQLASVSASFREFCGSIQTRVKGTEDGKVLKEVLDSLSARRADALKEVGVVKKQVVGIRSALKKFEQSQVQGMMAITDDNGGNEATGAIDFMQMVVDGICAKQGKSINVDSKFVVENRILRPYCSGKSSHAVAVQEIPVFRGLSNWLRNQRDKEKDKDHVVSSLEKAKFRNPLVAKVSELFVIPEPLLTKSISSDVHDQVTRGIFALTLCDMMPGYSSSGLLPFGVGQFTFLVSGSYLSIGVHIDAATGETYSAKLASVAALSYDGLVKLLTEKKAFVIHAVPGDLVFLLACFIVRQCALHDCVALRWSWADDDSRDNLAAVLASCMSVAASYPSTAVGPYKAWMSFLSSFLNGAT